MIQQQGIAKAFILMIAINLAQTLVAISLFIYEYAIFPNETVVSGFYLLPLIVIMALGGTFVAISLSRSSSFFRVKLRQNESSIQDLTKLNNTLREQRHDFMNHLQVVHSLIELKEFSEANSYIEKVFVDIEKVSRILKTSIPAVNAILQAKLQMCESRGIYAVINIRTSLSGIPVPDWELCRVLGNIIDNSINAIIDHRDNGRINIELYEDMQSYKFKISNNGPSIPTMILTQIFEPGYTTRSSRGDGMGLTICKRIMEEYEGSLSVQSTSKETAFYGIIPKQRSE